MKKCYLLDTDILIDCLRGNPKALSFIEKATVRTCYISSISVAELYAGVREGRERELLAQFLTAFETVDISPQVAQIGGLYRRDYHKSHQVGLADALIAASAAACKAELATLNQKHYPMIEHVHVPYAKH
ncbi:MAG: type II toxin-antitoxin system VapC family toxin [Gammaproteobacteria bacterium]|jgi:predicted nucleic acid-binding protein